MESEIYLEAAISLCSLLLISNILYLVSRKITFIPFPVLLVLVGLFLSPFAIPQIEFIELTPGLVLYILLPILLFESSFNFDFRIFKKIALPAFIFASIGLIISTLVVAFPLYYIFEIDFLSAFLFGTVISSTDPVAVLSILKKMGVPIKLNLLIDAESFFNDGTSLVIFKLVSIILFQNLNTGFSSELVFHTAFDFFYITFGGLFLGAFLGLVFAQVISQIQNAKFVEVAMTILLAFTAFILGEKVFEVSGVLSVLMAGLVMGNYGRSKISPQTYKHLMTIWEFLVYIATVIVFLLIGFKSNLDLIFEHWYIVLVTLITVFLSRSVAVYSIGIGYNLLSKKSEHFSMNWLHILNWGGLRGILPLALLLSLEDGYHYKELFLTMGYAIVLFTLTFNSLSIQWLIKKLNLDNIDSANVLEISIVKVLITKKLLKHLKNLSTIKEISEEVYEKQKTKLKQQLEKMVEEFKFYYSTTSPDEYNTQAQKIIFKYCLNIEKKVYKSLFEKNVISEPIYSKLAAKLTQQAEFIDISLNQFKDKSSIMLSDLVVRKDRSFGKTIKAMIFGDTIDTVEEFYMYHKARFLGNETVLAEIDYFKNQKIKVISDEIISKVEKIYTDLMNTNETTIKEIEKLHPNVCENLNVCSCSAEAQSLIHDIIEKFGEEGRVSEKALRNIHIEI